MRFATDRERKLKMIEYRHISTHAARETAQSSASLMRVGRIGAHVFKGTAWANRLAEPDAEGLAENDEI
jgi:hypothetical protein